MIKEQFTSPNAHLENFEKRRKYPRVVLGNRANLILPDYQSINLELHDLSVCAIQIRFDADTEDTIRSVVGQVDDKQLPDLDVRFNIELKDREEEIYVRCKPVYIQKLEPDMYAMGMIFMELEKKYQALINQFVEFSLEPL